MEDVHIFSGFAVLLCAHMIRHRIAKDLQGCNKTNRFFVSGGPARQWTLNFYMLFMWLHDAIQTQACVCVCMLCVSPLFQFSRQFFTLPALIVGEAVVVIGVQKPARKRTTHYSNTNVH